MENELKKSELLFIELVLQKQHEALVAMGKKVHPVNEGVERRLEHAKFIIEVLLMLRSKTKGNLSIDEIKLIDGIVADLQANLVQEENREKVLTDVKNFSRENTPDEEKTQ